MVDCRMLGTQCNAGTLSLSLRCPHTDSPFAEADGGTTLRSSLALPYNLPSTRLRFQFVCVCVNVYRVFQGSDQSFWLQT